MPAEQSSMSAELLSRNKRLLRMHITTSPQHQRPQSAPRIAGAASPDATLAGW
jgi:hypothetical protein